MAGVAMRMAARDYTCALGAALAVTFCPVRAEAHLVTTGLGPVYDGIGHLVTSPEDLVPVIALALFAGLRGAAAGRWALFLLPLAWMAGGWIGLLARGAPACPVPALSFLLLGVLVAADLRLPARGVAALALGLVHGFLNGAAMAPAGGGTLELIGVSAALFVLVALGAASVVSLKPQWARIAVRVVGSWVAASGLLLLGWALHRPG